MSHIPPVERDHLATALTPEPEHQAQLRCLRAGLFPKATVRQHSFSKARFPHLSSENHMSRLFTTREA